MIFIAAGKGSRLSKITNGNHKALIKINNKFLIDILFQNCLKIGIQEVIVVTGFKKHLIKEHAKTLKTDINIELIHNIDWQLPNGLSVLTAKDLIPKGEDFLLSMCDHFYFSSLLDIVKESNLNNTLVNIGIDYNLEKIYDIDDAMKIDLRVGVGGLAQVPREDLQEALDIFEKVGTELGVIGPHKEAMADHWANMAKTVGI